MIRLTRLFGLITVLMLAHGQASAQPVLNTKMNIGGRTIFKDALVKNKFYYGPGALQLSTDKDERPVFQLISMRYTGTTLSNDLGEKRFTNLLMFNVRMEAMTTELKKAIKAELPPNADLVPLPIRHLEAVIVSGVGKPDDDSGRMRKHATSQQDNPDAPGVYWSERNFTVPLDNHDAQILWDQVEQGRLVMSLNYAFYANVLKIQEESLEVSGDSAYIARINSAIGDLERDTQLVSETIRADVLNIGIDAKKHGDLLKKIDINEASIPPAYAAFEVKCFDFGLGIRPDLAFKTVEIEGESVTGVAVKTKVKFSHKQPDITGKFVSFPYAIRLDKPIRYKVYETPFEGEPTPAAWKILERFANLIDASTLQKNNPLASRCVDVEILPEYLTAKNLKEVTVHLIYQFEGRQQIHSITLGNEKNIFFGTSCITFEQETPIQYMVAKTFADGRKTKGILKPIGKDDYILIR